MFPSPYGVSFILINVDKIIIGTEKCTRFRLLTEYHSFLFNIQLKIWHNGMQVSVSLWSYIHSYPFDKWFSNKTYFLCFRLLMELYSFLPSDVLC